MSIQLKFCGKVDGHTFVYRCMTISEDTTPPPPLVRDYAHARQCPDCRSGIAVSIREHSQGNRAFDHARFYGAIDRLQQHADKL